MICAVIDTNVLVSYLISDRESPPDKVFKAIEKGTIKPLYNAFLLREYRRVLSEERFGIDKSIVFKILDFIETYGEGIEPIDFGSSLPDRKDSPIFDIVQATRESDSFMVTGNIKHFPKEDYVVTPRQMADMLDDINASRTGGNP